MTREDARRSILSARRIRATRQCRARRPCLRRRRPRLLCRHLRNRRRQNIWRCRFGSVRLRRWCRFRARQFPAPRARRSVTGSWPMARTTMSTSSWNSLPGISDDLAALVADSRFERACEYIRSPLLHLRRLPKFSRAARASGNGRRRVSRDHTRIETRAFPARRGDKSGGRFRRRGVSRR